MAVRNQLRQKKFSSDWRYALLFCLATFSAISYAPDCRAEETTALRLRVEPLQYAPPSSVINSNTLSSLNAARAIFAPTAQDFNNERVWTSSRSSLQLFDQQRDALPGQPVRRSPRLALGFRSNGLRNALESLGFEAQHCMAPIVRMRGKMSDSGGVSGTFWLSARCSIR